MIPADELLRVMKNLQLEVVVKDNHAYIYMGLLDVTDALNKLKEKDLVYQYRSEKLVGWQEEDVGAPVIEYYRVKPISP
jgi:hypothetical protein